MKGIVICGEYREYDQWLRDHNEQARDWVYGSERERVLRMRDFLEKNRDLAECAFSLEALKAGANRMLASRKIVRLAREARLYSPNTYELDAWNGLHSAWVKIQKEKE